jgi:hypothetical protein
MLLGTHTVPYHFGRNLNGTISVKMTKQRTTIPAPPTPWIDLPTSIRTTPGATQHSIVPTVKQINDATRQSGRPKMSLMAAMKGIVTAFARRYEVPIQKPCVVSPPRSVTMVWSDIFS